MDKELIEDALLFYRGDQKSKKQPRPERFVFPFKPDDMAEILTACYREEVKGRGEHEFRATPETTRIIGSVSRWMTDESKRPGLILMGATPGTGKTTLAKALITATYVAGRVIGGWNVEESERGRALSRIPFFKFTTAAELERARQAEAVADANGSPSDSPFTKLCNTDVEVLGRGKVPFTLIVDDIGTENANINVYGTAIAPFADFVFSRYDNQRPAILTTNLSGKAISERYGARVWDRLRDMCEVVAFKFKNEESFRG